MYASRTRTFQVLVSHRSHIGYQYSKQAKLHLEKLVHITQCTVTLLFPGKLLCYVHCNEYVSMTLLLLKTQAPDISRGKEALYLTVTNL